MNVVGKASVHTYLDMMDEQTFYGIKEANDTILSSALVELEVLSEAWKARETALTEAGAVSMPSVAKVERRTDGIMDSIANFIRKVIQFLADIGNKFGQVLEEFKNDADYVKDHLQDLGKIMDPPNDTYKEIQKNTTLTFVPYYTNKKCMDHLGETMYPDGANLPMIMQRVQQNNAAKADDVNAQFPNMLKLGDNPRDAALAYYRGEDPDHTMGPINVQGENIKPALQAMIKFTTQDYVRYHTAAETLRKNLNKAVKSMDDELSRLGNERTNMLNAKVKPAAQPNQNQQQQAPAQNNPTGESFGFNDPSYSILEEASLKDTEFNFLMEADDQQQAEQQKKPAPKPDAKVDSDADYAAKYNQARNEYLTAAQGANSADDFTSKHSAPPRSDGAAYQAYLDVTRWIQTGKTGNPPAEKAGRTTNAAPKNEEPQGQQGQTAQTGQGQTGNTQAPNKPKAKEVPKEYESKEKQQADLDENNTKQEVGKAMMRIIQIFQSIVTAKMTVMEEVEREYMRVLRGVINGLTGANTQMERNAANRRANNAQDRKEEEEHQRKLTATRRQGEQLAEINKANRAAKKAGQGWFRNLFT